MPKVSVVMPTFNAAEYLSEAIQSILEQTFTDFEFLIVDDNSTDGTCEMIRSFADPRIRLIEGPCRGISAALNAGLDAAQGEYIARMDADDIALPERFARQVQFLDANAEYGLCGTRAHYYSGKYELGIYGARHVEHPGLIDQLVCSVVLHSTTMFRKDLFLRHGLHYDEEYLTTEDQELWSRALHYTKFYNIQEPLQRYRKSANSTSKSKAAQGTISFAKTKAAILHNLFPSAAFPADNPEELNRYIAGIIEAFMVNEPKEEREKVIKLLNLKPPETLRQRISRKLLRPVAAFFLPPGSARRRRVKQIYYKLRGWA